MSTDEHMRQAVMANWQDEPQAEDGEQCTRCLRFCYDPHAGQCLRCGFQLRPDADDEPDEPEWDSEDSNRYQDELEGTP